MRNKTMSYGALWWSERELFHFFLTVYFSFNMVGTAVLPQIPWDLQDFKTHMRGI